MQLPLNRLKFDKKIDFIPEYDWSINDNYLKKLNHEFKIQNRIKDKGDIESVMILCNWVHAHIKHDGVGVATKLDALTILNEAKSGKLMRCVEYATALTEVLIAAGFNARCLSLRSKDIELREYGGGHIVTEIYLPTLKKWILVDGQFNMIPFLYKKPLNAVELRDAIIMHFDEVEFMNIKGKINDNNKNEYIWFILQYLFYFSFNNDQRLGFKKNGIGIRLGAKGAKNPKLFQGKLERENFKYTHSLGTFYYKP